MKTLSIKFAFLVLSIAAFQLVAVANGKQAEGTYKAAKKDQSSDVRSDKIEVLNFGTFHMGKTSDSFSVPFDPIAEKEAVHAAAKQLAEFKPTVIVVERAPEDDAEIQAEYEEYVKTPGMKFQSVSEIQLLAYEIGRLSKATRSAASTTK